MSETISYRIYDFLKNHPPFSFIEKPELISICQRITVAYHEVNEILFRQGELPGKYFYVVREGAVQLYNDYGSTSILVDICDEGDIFGIRPIVSKNEAYLLTAKVSEEALVYQIPVNAVNHLLTEESDVKNFFDTSFIGGVRNPYSYLKKNKNFTPCDDNWITDFNLTEIKPIPIKDNPITCSSDLSIREAAVMMRDKNIGSIIITDDKKFPVGILTDKDLSNKVATGIIGINSQVSEIMSSPVITESPKITIADLQINMLQNKIHHICITEDGTNKSKLLGIVSEHDLLVSHGNDPAVLIKEIRRANSGEELNLVKDKAESLLLSYLRQQVSIIFISRIMTELNDSITIRAIEISVKELESENVENPGLDWCWLALGSQGREEQTLKTDLDNAIIFQNTDKENYQPAKEYHLKLAGKVNRILNNCGFDYCPAEMMASNPKWCLSLDEWKNQFDNWIYSPGEKEVMYSTIFFDYRRVYGEQKLVDELTENVFKSISKQESFLSFLAKNALQNPPPLSFFRNFMVENNGEHKDEFDIKARAMMPLIDAARVLILAENIPNINNTGERYLKLAEVIPAHKELFEEAADAYEILMRFRTLQGLRHKSSGRYFKPEDLNKMQRLMLRNSFVPIKEIQSIFTVRFNLNLFR